MLLNLVASATGITPRRIAGTYGGEYASSCPFCGGRDRFRVWPQKKGGKGRWWCRQCKKTGDTADFLIETGQAKNFREAKEKLGLADTAFRPKPQAEERRGFWHPNSRWQSTAKAFVKWAMTYMDAHYDDLERERGIKPDTAIRYKLGWNPHEWKRPRDVWGLPDRPDGREHVWIPAGWVIPARRQGVLYRVRIRRHNSKGVPYVALEGSCGAPMLVRSGLRYIIVESELDGILLAQELPVTLGIIALGSAWVRPDKELKEKLLRSEQILVALDADDAGESAAQYWMETFPFAKRLKPQGAKDPGDMWKKRISLTKWVSSVLH